MTMHPTLLCLFTIAQKHNCELVLQVSPPREGTGLVTAYFSMYPVRLEWTLAVHKDEACAWPGKITSEQGAPWINTTGGSPNSDRDVLRLMAQVLDELDVLDDQLGARRRRIVPNVISRAASD